MASQAEAGAASVFFLLFYVVLAGGLVLFSLRRQFLPLAPRSTVAIVAGNLVMALTCLLGLVQIIFGQGSLDCSFVLMLYYVCFPLACENNHREKCVEISPTPFPHAVEIGLVCSHCYSAFNAMQFFFCAGAILLVRMGRISALSAIQTLLVRISTAGSSPEAESDNDELALEDIWKSDGNPGPLPGGSNPDRDSDEENEQSGRSSRTGNRATADLDEQPDHPEGEAMGLPDEEPGVASGADERAYDADDVKRSETASLRSLEWLRLLTQPWLLSCVIGGFAALWIGLGLARVLAADGNSSSLQTPDGSCIIGAQDLWTVVGVTLALYVPAGIFALWATSDLTDVFSIRLEFMVTGCALLLSLTLHVTLGYVLPVQTGVDSGGVQAFGGAGHALLVGAYAYLFLSLWLPVVLSFSQSFQATNRAIEKRALLEGGSKPAAGGAANVFESARLRALMNGNGNGDAGSKFSGARNAGAGALRRVTPLEAVTAALDTYARIGTSFRHSHILGTVGPEELLALCRQLAEAARDGTLLRNTGESDGIDVPASLGGPEAKRMSVGNGGGGGGSSFVGTGTLGLGIGSGALGVEGASHGSRGSSRHLLTDASNQDMVGAMGGGMGMGSRGGSGSFLGQSILAEAEASSMLAGLVGAMSGKRGVLQLAQARCPANLQDVTLTDLLSHRPLYTRFRDYLKSEFSTENLLFFEQVSVFEIGLVERLVQRGLVWGPGEMAPTPRQEAYFVQVQVQGQVAGAKLEGGAGGGGGTSVGGSIGRADPASERASDRDTGGGDGTTVGSRAGSETASGARAGPVADKIGALHGGVMPGVLTDIDALLPKVRDRSSSMDDTKIVTQGGVGHHVKVAGDAGKRILHPDGKRGANNVNDENGPKQHRDRSIASSGNDSRELAGRADSDSDALAALRKITGRGLEAGPGTKEGGGEGDGGRGENTGHVHATTVGGGLQFRAMKSIPADLRLMLGGITHVAQRGVRAMFSGLLRSMREAAGRGWMPPEGQDHDAAAREVCEYVKEGTQAITERFVKPGAPLEVNISSSQRRAVLRVAKKKSTAPAVLVPAKREIRRLMQMDSLPRFRSQAGEVLFFDRYQGRFKTMVTRMEGEAAAREQRRQRRERRRQERDEVGDEGMDGDILERGGTGGGSREGVSSITSGSVGTDVGKEGGLNVGARARQLDALQGIEGDGDEGGTSMDGESLDGLGGN